MTFAPVSLSADDLATLDRCVQQLLRNRCLDDGLALGALTMRLSGAYFAALPIEEFSRRVESDERALTVLRGGAA